MQAEIWEQNPRKISLSCVRQSDSLLSTRISRNAHQCILGFQWHSLCIKPSIVCAVDFASSLHQKRVVRCINTFFEFEQSSLLNCIIHKTSRVVPEIQSQTLVVRFGDCQLHRDYLSVRPGSTGTIRVWVDRRKLTALSLVTSPAADTVSGQIQLNVILISFEQFQRPDWRSLASQRLRFHFSGPTWWVSSIALVWCSGMTFKKQNYFGRQSC